MSIELSIKVLVLDAERAPALLAAIVESLGDREPGDEVTIVLQRQLTTARSQRTVKDKITLYPQSGLTETEAADLLGVVRAAQATLRPLELTPLERYINQMDAEDTHAAQ